MASTTENEMTLERFAALADTYGADLNRWPTATRVAARDIADHDPAAARKLIEARSLDRLIDLAPVAAPSPGLVDRIVSAAAASPRLAPRAAVSSSTGGNVIPLQRGASTSIGPSARSSEVTHDGALLRQDSSRRLHRRHAAGAGGMLAASLLLGIWLGASGMTTAFGPELAVRHGVTDLEAMSEIVQSALPADLMDGIDEDTL